MVLLKSAPYDFANSTYSKNQKFYLVLFNEKGSKEFLSEIELIDQATKDGYKGSFDFLTVEEYSSKFSESPNY
jgi:hypothetical protein